MTKQELRNLILGLALGSMGLTAIAAVSVPHSFSSGGVIKSAEVNANFAALGTAIDGKQARVTGECASGTAVRTVAADGTVTCEAINGGAGVIPDGSVTRAKLSVTGTVADGKVLKSQGSNLVWGTDETLAFTGSLSGSTIGPGLQVSNSSNGVGAGAIFGRLQNVGAGNDSYALKGQNDSGSGAGAGVWGTHAGPGVAVYGEAGPAGIGVRGKVADTGYGVQGLAGNGFAMQGVASTGGTGVEGTSVSGVGVSARSTSGAALQVDGAIKVAGTNTRPAFVHTTTGGPSGNTAFNETTIDNALANDDPNAMVIVTHQYSGSYLPLAYGVYYSGTRWRIFLESGTSAMPVGEKFNVLIIKQ